MLQVLSATGESVWIYAWGRSNTFVEHVVDGHAVLALDSCNVQSPGVDSSAKQYAHAWWEGSSDLLKCVTLGIHLLWF